MEAVSRRPNATFPVSLRLPMHPSRPTRDVERAELSPVAAYIGQLVKELASLARAEGCFDLAYMLQIAAIEAERMGGPPEGSRLS